MDYLVPTAMETPKWETDKTVTPSPPEARLVSGLLFRVPAYDPAEEGRLTLDQGPGFIFGA